MSVWCVCVCVLRELPEHRYACLKWNLHTASLTCLLPIYITEAPIKIHFKWPWTHTHSHHDTHSLTTQHAHTHTLRNTLKTFFLPFFFFFHQIFCYSRHWMYTFLDTHTHTERIAHTHRKNCTHTHAKHSILMNKLWRCNFSCTVTEIEISVVCFLCSLKSYSFTESCCFFYLDLQLGQHCYRGWEYVHIFLIILYWYTVLIIGSDLMACMLVCVCGWIGRKRWE